MINVDITKILFVDIETVGIERDLETLKEKRPELYGHFIKNEDWVRKRFAECSDCEINELYLKTSGLIPEFLKIVTICLGLVDGQGNMRTQIFSNGDEKTLLIEVKKMFEKCNSMGYFLCGHNLKNFDIPVTAKRMIINGLKPPAILPTPDTKPWEIKAIDTMELWKYGVFGTLSNLDLMCCVMDIPSPKDSGIDGSMVHNVYWFENDLERINKYCERDTHVLFDVIKKFKSLV
jgi:predicted PolB exonuclease-like 3'-5' exonuclease